MKACNFILISIVIIVGVCIISSFSRGLETTQYKLTDKVITEDTIILEGEMHNDLMKYTKYTYRFENGNLYVRIHGSLNTIFDRTREERSGEFKIEFDVHQFDKQVENIYFQGRMKNDLRIIQ